MSRRYSKEEREFLKLFVPGHSYKEIQAAFNERFEPIELTQVKSYIKNNHLNTGRKGCFMKGHVPANKGKKMSPEVYEKCAPTMFKKGSTPKNTYQIGTEQLCSDGYIWVKIDNQPKGGKYKNWKQKHLLVWEAAHGPVPEDHVVIFLNGDRTDCSLENLKLISKAQNVAMNKFSLRTNDKELTEMGTAVASLKLAAVAARRKGKK